MGTERLEAFSDGVIAVIITIMVLELHAPQGTDPAALKPVLPSALARALGKDFKNKVSALLYALAIPLAFVRAWVAGALYVVVAIIWLIPDRRIERSIAR